MTAPRNYVRERELHNLINDLDKLCETLQGAMQDAMEDAKEFGSEQCALLSMAECKRALSAIKRAADHLADHLAEIEGGRA